MLRQPLNLPPGDIPPPPPHDSWIVIASSVLLVIVESWRAATLTPPCAKDNLSYTAQFRLFSDVKRLDVVVQQITILSVVDPILVGRAGFRRLSLTITNSLGFIDCLTMRLGQRNLG